MVTIRLFIVSRLSPCSRLKWDQVSAAPEVSSSIVLSRGISQGFLGSIPTGGQTPPML